MEKPLTKKQYENAKRAGLTRREAEKLVRETKHNEALDKSDYRAMSNVERDAHNNR